MQKMPIKSLLKKEAFFFYLVHVARWHVWEETHFGYSQTCDVIEVDELSNLANGSF